MLSNILPNSPCRVILDAVINLNTPVFGKALTNYSITLIEKNYLTAKMTTYSQGVITNTQGGNNNNLDDGQGNKSYQMSFGLKVELPLV